MSSNCLTESLYDYIGQTVTIFTTGGGTSGSGFTGVLLSVDCDTVKLISRVGAAPACPVGSSCTGVMSPYGIQNGCGVPYGNPLGCVAVIPVCAISCFTHNAI